LLQGLADAGNCPARADSRDEDIHRAVGVVPYLNRSGLAMHLGVGRVLKLLGHEGPFGLFQEFLCAGDSALHAL